MAPSDTRRAEANLRVALELYEIGEQMMRQRLRREHPDASEAELLRLLGVWLHERPGAEHGDAPGRLVELPGTKE